MSLETYNATHAIFHLPHFSQRHELKSEGPTYGPFINFTKSLMFAHQDQENRVLPLKIS